MKTFAASHKHFYKAEGFGHTAKCAVRCMGMRFEASLLGEGLCKGASCRMHAVLGSIFLW